jgi:hypothetical protein
MGAINLEAQVGSLAPDEGTYTYIFLIWFRWADSLMFRGRHTLVMPSSSRSFFICKILSASYSSIMQSSKFDCIAGFCNHVSNGIMH